jgi:hypothetical protein
VARGCYVAQGGTPECSNRKIGRTRACSRSKTVFAALWPCVLAERLASRRGGTGTVSLSSCLCGHRCYESAEKLCHTARRTMQRGALVLQCKAAGLLRTPERRRTTACSRLSRNGLCGSLTRLPGGRVGSPHCAILESNAGTVSWFMRRLLGCGWAVCPPWEISIRNLEKKVAASVLCDDLDSLSAEGVTLFEYGLCTNVGGSRREFGQRLV